MEAVDIESVKRLFDQLKEDRVILNWHEFAKLVGMDRTYISRVLNGHEPITQGFLDKINCGIANATKNVDSGTLDKERIIQALEKQVLLLENEVERLKQELRISSTDLGEYALANNAYLKTILECIGKHRALTEQIELEKIEEQHDTILASKTRETLKNGKAEIH